MATSLEQKLTTLSTDITELDLNASNLSGEIPDSISNFTNLQILDLSENKLTGEIPSCISSLIKLKHLFFGNNNFCGEIPSCFSSLTNLHTLDLSENKLFAGEIPLWISSLSNLHALYLYDTNLCGEIPSSISSLSNLSILNLNYNYLTGKIPSCISSLTNLQQLSLRNNKLTGEIPDSISSLSTLQVLYLHNNNLSGEIPSSISALSKLGWLALENNYFLKPIPEWLYTNINSLNIKNAFQYFPIWNEIKIEYEWSTEDVDIIHKIEELIKIKNRLPNTKEIYYHELNKLSSTKDPYITLHENSKYTWEDIHSYLKVKQPNSNHLTNLYKFKLNNINNEYNDIVNMQKQLEEQLELIKQERKQIEERKQQIIKEIEEVKYPIEKINNIIKQVEEITLGNKQINNKVNIILEQSDNLQEPISEDDLQILLERMNLVQYYDICKENELYDDMNDIDSDILQDIEMNSRDTCCFLYNIEMIKYKCFFYDITTDCNEDIDCIVCEHNTPIKTIELLKEYNIEIDKDIIIDNNWITPYLIFLGEYNEIGINKSQNDMVTNILKEWKQIHENHLTNIIFK